MEKFRIKIDRITVTVGLVLLFIAVLPNVPFLKENAVVATVIFIGALGILAALWQRNIYDEAIAAVLVVGFFLGNIGSTLEEPLFVVLRSAAVLAFLLLSFVLLIGPATKIRGFMPAVKLLANRRHLGVSVFLLASLHVHLVYAAYFDYQIVDAYALGFTLFGSIAFTILTVMAATSNDYVLRNFRVKIWSVIHGLFFVATLLEIIFVARKFNESFEPWQFFVFAAFCVWWLAVAPWTLPKYFQPSVNGWKQVHVLIFIGYTSIIIHVMESGRLADSSTATQIAFYGIAGIVWAAHITKWIYVNRLRWKNKREMAEKVRIAAEAGKSAETPAQDQTSIPQTAPTSTNSQEKPEQGQNTPS